MSDSLADFERVQTYKCSNCHVTNGEFGRYNVRYIFEGPFDLGSSINSSFASKNSICKIFQYFCFVATLHLWLKSFNGFLVALILKDFGLLCNLQSVFRPKANQYTSSYMHITGTCSVCDTFGD